MSIINYEIQPDGFELIRDAIGAILKVELENQKAIQPANITEDIIVLSESITAYSIAEECVINVWYDNSPFGTINEKDAQSRTIFNIDIYSRGKASDGETGDMNSAKRIHKFLRLCRHILSFTGYNTLGEQFIGLIGGTYVESIEMLDPKDSEDSSFTRFGRITFAVRIQEGQNLFEGIKPFQSFTQIKLQETEQGYRYEFNT